MTRRTADTELVAYALLSARLMAASTDTFTSTLAFYGRLCDALRRETVDPSDYRVFMVGSEKEAFRKPDGFFVFQNLKPSPAVYEIAVIGARFQERRFHKNLPTPDPVEVAFPGEDEFYLGIKSVNAVAKTVTFDKVPFLPKIPGNSPVSGEGGFTAALAEELQGVDASTAHLTSVAGLAPGGILRIVRSRALLARPNPYYSFPRGLTLLHVKVTGGPPPAQPLEGALIRILTLNALVPASASVGGLVVKHVTLPAPPNPILALGPDRELETRSDSRGQAVFFFPGYWPLAALQMETSHPGHANSITAAALNAGQRTLAAVTLVPI